MIRVLLLDDHELVRRGLTDRPDVAVLDARLPDGIDVGRDVRAVDSTIKGLILTSYEDDEAPGDGTLVLPDRALQPGRSSDAGTRVTVSTRRRPP